MAEEKTNAFVQKQGRLFKTNVQKGGGGGYIFLIKRRNFEWEVEWEGVDPMEESNMRTITTDANTKTT